ncbi:MAG TPA: preprotein translocase subunit SecG [Rhizomicrobium sp.]|jgi:preprotein translocase subunit SecG|nr:preprotein translocase subunit SecG [Rhizomicrobium sp.]
MQGLQVVLLVFQVFISAALIVVVLLQRSEGGALGMGGGGSGLGGLFSPRGAADTLTRTTAILAALFFIVSMALTLLALHGRAPTSILSAPAAPASRAVPAPAPAEQPVPTLPSVPKPQ